MGQTCFSAREKQDMGRNMRRQRVCTESSKEGSTGKVKVALD